MYKLKLSQKIAYTAVFAAICVVLKFVKFDTGNLSITFSYIPNFLAGIFLGPIYGLAVGFTGDLLGTLLKGWTISPLILLGNALMGFIVGIVYRYSYIKNIYFKIIAGAFCVLVIVTYGINTYAQLLPPISRFPTFLISLSARLPQGLVLAINTGLVMALYTVFDKTIFKNLEKKDRYSLPKTKNYK